MHTQTIQIMQEEIKDMAAEPFPLRQMGSASDGLLAYITAQNTSAAARWELGNRLMHDAERDMTTRPAFELAQQIREICHYADRANKPNLDSTENAIRFVDACPDNSLLLKSASYITDHATVMLKMIVGNIVSSVDIGEDSYTFAIVNPETMETEMGEGSASDMKSIKSFYKDLKRLAR